MYSKEKTRVYYFVFKIKRPALTGLEYGSGY
jgi:hypothetical protein